MAAVSSPKPLSDRVVLNEDAQENENTYIDTQIKAFIEANRKDLETLRDVYARVRIRQSRARDEGNTYYIGLGNILERFLNDNNYQINDLLIIKILTDGISREIEARGFEYSYADSTRVKITIEEVLEIAIEMIDKLRKVTLDFQEHFYNRNINIDYFIFLDLDNPKVKNLFEPIKLTPQTFKLFEVNTPEENVRILEELKEHFYPGYRSGAYRFGNFHSIGDPYSSGKWAGDQWAAGGIKIYDDPGFKQYSGWTKKQLREALVEAGVFDSEKEKYGARYGYKFPKLKELGIPNPIPIIPDTPNRYIIGLPRHVLEALYSRLVDTTIDWDQVCQSGADLEYLRAFVKEHLNITIDGNREEFCVRLSSIVRNLELKEVLPEFRQEFIMYPGTTEHPRIMYTKYADATKFGGFKPARVDIERYLSEIRNVCADPSKGTREAYQIVVDIGLQNYVSRTESKAKICDVVQRYLNVIREERIY